MIIRCYSKVSSRDYNQWNAKYNVFKGFVDQNGYEIIDNVAKKLEAAGQAGDWKKVITLSYEMETLVDNVTDNMDWYNILNEVEAVSKPCKNNVINT